VTVRQHVILVGERDEVLRTIIASKLQEEGYAVLTTADGPSLADSVQEAAISLLLLDSSFLHRQELTIYRQLQVQRQKAPIPILLMVSSQDEIAYFTRLDPHIDDYIMKPLMWEELHACVETLLRKGKGRQKTNKAVPKTKPRQPYPEEQVLTAGDLSIDVKRYHVIRCGQRIEFNQPRLFDLLIYLVRHRGIVLTRDQLLQHVWGYEHLHDSRTVDVHIHWLREKLEEDPAHPQLIQTIRGVGYRFKE
jgi:two-component system alkaline phosphatase synthesis response regulator PhoP